MPLFSENQNRKPIKTALLTLIVASVSSYFLSSIACYFGLLFSGMDFFGTIFLTVLICSVSIMMVAYFLRSKSKVLSWFSIFRLIFIIEFAVVLFLSHLGTNDHLRNFLNPVPKPKNLHVIAGRSTLFITFIHFQAKPSDIAAIIKAKKMVEAPSEFPNELSEGFDVGAFNERTRSSNNWDWWQPTLMSNPKFFYLGHTSEGPQGWSEGWWVNGDTNEVFALISG